jgi:hypothetical protein
MPPYCHKSTAGKVIAMQPGDNRNVIRLVYHAEKIE